MNELQTTNPTRAGKKVIPSIDLMRVICSVLVVIIHTQNKGSNDLAGYIFSQMLPRLAVPFFFAVSGYFLAISLQKKPGTRTILKYLRRILETYILWTVIYYFNSLEYNLRYHVPLGPAAKKFIVNFFTIGSSYHFWYLTALILSVAVFALFYSLGLVKVLVPVSVVLYIIGLLGVSYHGIGMKISFLEPLFRSSQFTPISRAFMMGIPFFVLGYMVNTFKKSFEKLQTRTVLLILSALILGFVLEIIYVRTMHLSLGITVTAFLYLLTAWVLVTCIRFPLASLAGQSMAFRHISNFTYYAHPMYIKFFDILLKRKFKIVLTQVPEVVVICILTAISAVIIMKINNKYLSKLIA